MKRIISLLITIVLVLTVAMTTFAHEKSPPDSATNTYFIAFESKIDKNVIKSQGGEIKHQYKYIPVITAKLPAKAVEALSKNPNIPYIEQDTKAYATSQVEPWGIKHVKATDA